MPTLSGERRIASDSGIPPAMNKPPATTAAPASTTGAPPASTSVDLVPSSRKTTGYIVGGIGAAGLVVGTVLAAVVAKGKYNDSLKECRTDKPDLCNAKGKDLRDSARSMGNVATIVGGLGAVALVAGGVMVLTAPADKKSGRIVIAPTVGTQGAGAVIVGGF